MTPLDTLLAAEKTGIYQALGNPVYFRGNEPEIDAYWMIKRQLPDAYQHVCGLGFYLKDHPEFEQDLIAKAITYACSNPHPRDYVRLIGYRQEP
jgi:hypothetical protein